MRRRDATTALALLTVGMLAGQVSVYSAAAEDRTPREDLFVADRLHFNDEGYRILAASVREHLQ